MAKPTPPAAPQPSQEDINAQMHAELIEMAEQSELWQRRYRQEIERGLSLELGQQKFEKRAMQLEQEVERLTAALAEATTVKDN